MTNYANDYEDPAKGKECALALHDQGADVIFQVAGNTGNGVFEAAAEQNFYVIGVDQDQKISAAEYDDQIICSMKKEVGKSIYDTIAAYINDGTWGRGQSMDRRHVNGLCIYSIRRRIIYSAGQR